MEQKKCDIFISYSRVDFERVMALVKDIETKTGASCWIDFYGIESGSQFEDVIIKAINETEIVFLMITKNLKDYGYTKKEIEYAIAKKKKIVPILLDDSEWPDWVHFKFNGSDYIDINNDSQYLKLLGDIRKWIGKEAITASNSIQIKGELKKQSNPQKYLWGIVVSTILIILLCVMLWPNHAEEQTAQEAPSQTVENAPITAVIDGDLYTDNLMGIPFTMIKVEGGEYIVGDPKTSSDSTVKLNTFFICETEVTQALWQVVMKNNPSFFKGPNRPVEQVSYDSCLVFIDKLSRLKGRKFRLPTEAEWEVAAKGGKKSKGYLFAGSNNLSECGWYWQNSGKDFLKGNEYDDWDSKKILGNDSQTHDVKMKKPNELGLYDMSGNVEEWCADLFYKDGLDKGKINMLDYVYRGGSWCCNAKECEVYTRMAFTHNNCHRSLGFRLASDN